MMNKTMFFIMLLSIACSNNGAQGLEPFYARTEGRDLSVLFGLTLKPRGTNEDGSYKVHKIQYNRKDAAPLTIPVFDDRTSEKEWLDSSLFQIKEFAELKGMNESPFLEVKAFSDSVVSLYNELEVISIESYPRLGEFIVFQVNSEEQAIYIRDTSMVNHPYWKKFFRETKPERENWYYRKKELSN